MRAVILAGGFGTRLSEETQNKPKPMVEIGGTPILHHILNVYSKFDINDFVILTGYRSNSIQDWARKQKMPWRIQVMYTGLKTQTGGRVRIFLENASDKEFFLTYGDGLANLNLNELLIQHHANKTLATLTAVRPPARFGYLRIVNNLVQEFSEKSQTDEGWINGGFMVLNRDIVKYIGSDNDSLEFDTLPKLSAENNLGVYFHNSFWKPMDSLRDKLEFDKLSTEFPPPWLRTFTSI